MNINKFFKYFLLSVFLMIFFQDAAIYAQKNTSYKYVISGEIKPSCFFFQDSTFKDIFGNSSFMIGAEARASLHRFLQLFAEVEYLYAKGLSKTSPIYTTLQIIPVSLGLKGICPIHYIVDLYAKLGPNWIYVKEISDYPYFHKNVHKDTFGITSGIGLLVHVIEHFSLDLFTNYIYGKKHYTDKYSNTKIKRDFGGFQFGLGLCFSY